MFIFFSNVQAGENPPIFSLPLLAQFPKKKTEVTFMYEIVVSDLVYKVWY